MDVEQLVESVYSGENEMLGRNLPQWHFVYQKYMQSIKLIFRVCGLFRSVPAFV
jgi:hypothetical protein